MKRYVLVDFLHLAYKTMALPQLSTTVMVGNQLQSIDTTIPNYTIKNVFTYSGRGAFYTAVCLEGGKSKRNEYFRNQPGSKPSAGYKGTRNREQGGFYQGVNTSVNLLHQGKVSCYRVEGLEADDCIASLVQKIKMVDTITPIDIITGDADMLPLVDEQVSVYMKGTRQHAEDGCPQLRGYYQVTPDTWEEYLSYTSAYRNFIIPYNSMLLFKMIRGDKSDNINPATKGYGGVKYSKLMEEMHDDGVDFANTFRYGVDFDEVMLPVLMDYFDDTELAHMKYIYEGMNPIYHNLEIPRQLDIGYLQPVLNPLSINLVR